MPLRGYMCHTSASSRKQKQKARKGFAIVLALALLAKCACRRGSSLNFSDSLLCFGVSRKKSSVPLYAFASIGESENASLSVYAFAGGVAGCCMFCVW